MKPELWRAWWARWLRKCGLPPRHVAAVLNIAAETIERDAAIVSRQIPANPTCPPHCPLRANPRELYSRPILAQTGNKVRVLHALGYDAARIGQVLWLARRRVRSFIERTTPLRPEKCDGALSRPRSHPEERQARRTLRRREAVEAWGSIGACHRAEQAAWAELEARPAAVELVPAIVEPLDQAAVDGAPVEPRPAPEPWVGPASTKARGAAHGSAKLTQAKADEVRRLRAGGQSIYSLARQFHVAENTIRAIVTGRTWTDC